jgi:predicted Zn-dependent peptidase
VTDKSGLIKMEFKQKILKNGLTIIGELNDSAKSAAVGFFVKTGSRDENPQINGVSHFLEHMLFKGTEKFSSFEVSAAFDRTGAQFNAFTSEEITTFYAAALPEYIPQITSLWIELMRPALRDDDFNVEKDVIKQEIAMYQDLPDFEASEKCRTLYFDSHPCGQSILGRTESIDNLTAEQMRSYFNSRYVPNNMSLVAAGNFNWQQICSLAEQGCSNWQKIPVSRNTDDYKGSSKTEHIEKPNIAREHICLMSYAVSAQNDRRFAAFLLATVIGDSTGSRLFWELVDKALAEEAATRLGAMDGTGVFQTYIQCSPANVDKVLDTVSRIFSDVAENGITKDELTKAKNKILSALVIKNEVPIGRLFDVGLNWTYLNQYRTITDDLNAIKSVTVNQVCELAKELKITDYTRFSIGPLQKS